MATGAPRLQRWSNNGASTITAAVDAIQTTMTVASAAVFPDKPDFILKLDNEIVKVTAVSGATYTIERAQEGTSAGSHAMGAGVGLYNTEAGIERAYQDAFGLPDYPLNRVLELGTTRVESDFNWVNQGTATSTTADDGGILMTCPSEVVDNIRFKYRTIPGTPGVTPWKITTYCMLGPGMKDWTGSGTDGSYMGPILRESSTGKLYILALRGDRIALWRMTNPTTFSAEVDTYINNNRHAMWLQIEDDTVDIKASVSVDGYVWEECFNEGRTAFMTGGPDQMGFGIASGQGTAGMHFYHKSWIFE